MIVDNGLGNTLTDVGDNISTANYTGVVSTLVSGLANGDGWAYMISASVLYLGYRLYQGVKSAPKRLEDSRAASRRKTISSLESRISGLKTKK